MLADDTKIIVEMQNRYQTHFGDRALFYMATDIHAQGEKGAGWDYKLTPVYGIFIMNFEWKGEKEQHLREDVCLYNTQTRHLFSDKMRMTFLKIPMMHKDAQDCKTMLEKWIYLLKHMDKMEGIPKIFTQDPIFERLGKVARYAALDEKEKKAYNESLKAYRDNYAIAETERAEGRAEGHAEAATKIARTMLQMGLDPHLAAKATGIPVEKLLTMN